MPEVQCAMDLCLSIGCTLGELGKRMTTPEFNLWFQQWLSRPWGSRRGDLQAGIVAATVANFSGKHLKKDKTLAPVDFMPYIDEREDETPDVDPLEHFRAIGA